MLVPPITIQAAYDEDGVVGQRTWGLKGQGLEQA